MIDGIVQKVRERSGYGLEAWAHPRRFRLGVTLLVALSFVFYLGLYTSHAPDPPRLFGLVYFPTVALLASVLFAILD